MLHKKDRRTNSPSQWAQLILQDNQFAQQDGKLPVATELVQ